MDPTNTHSRRPNLLGLFLKTSLALALVIGFLFLGGVAFLYYGLRPHYDRVIWYYDDFQIVGSTTTADQLSAEGHLPQNVIVEGLRGRFVPPSSEVIESTGQRVELSTITWDSAIAMAPKPPFRLADGQDLVDMLDEAGGTKHLDVHFQGQRIVSIGVWGHVRIHNTSNGRSLDLQAKWSDVERVFGKPVKKEKKRIYHNKWVNYSTDASCVGYEVAIQSHTESARAVASG